MTSPPLSSETLHVSCVAKDGAAILISGRSGSGKSDLTLRLIDRGATLVSDDYTLVKRISGRLVAAAPANIAGKLEVRNLGILEFDHVSDVPIGLYVDLDRPVERQPDMEETFILAGVKLPVIAVSSLEASAPVKVELALERFGLKP
jgi:serine kinase of HPr protein (carbohydrate metabolism regulator)